jgi:aspartate kinase
MIATSEVSISLTLDESHDLDTLKDALSHFAHVKMTKDQSIVSLIGNTEESTSIFNQAFEILESNKINIKMVSYGASHVNIGFIIDSVVLEKTINVLHDGLIFEEEVTVC